VHTLQSCGDGIWIAHGPIVRAYGIPFDTRMTVVRLSDGSVWINSPVQWPPEEMRALNEIGPMRHFVSPTPLHDWRLEAWSKVFPEARCWKAADLRDEPPPEWVTDFDQMMFRGSRVLNEVYFLHRKTRTLIFGDFIQNHQPGNVVLKLLGASGGVPMDIRLSFAGNAAQARASLERLLSWDFDRVILAHGECVMHDAKSFVRRAFRWL
jgi:hypothetical protein